MATSLKVSQWLRKFDLLTLRLFVSIVEEGSIGKAAEREKMAASGATKRLRALEEGIGCKLINRNARGAMLTAAGQVAAQRAREVLATMDSLGHDIDQIAGNVQGSIRVWSTPTTLVQFLAEDVAGFTHSFPQTRFELQSGFTPLVVKAAESGEADVAVCSRPAMPMQGISLTPYCIERLVVVMSPNHRLSRRHSLSLADVLGDLIGWTPEGAVMDEVRRYAAAAGLEAAPKFKVSSMDAARALVRLGLGVAIVPEGVATVPDDAGRVCVRELDETWAERELCILTHCERNLSAEAQAFVAYLAQSRRPRPGLVGTDSHGQAQPRAAPATVG